MENNWVKGYIAGIIDAEGSFSISIKKQYDLRCKIRIQPVFNITQENIESLLIVKDYLGCGRIIKKPGQTHLNLYVIDSLNELYNCAIEKINKLNIIVKRNHFKIFREIVEELVKTMYNRSECCKIKELVYKVYEFSQLNSKSKRKLPLEDIIKFIPCNEAEEPPGER